MIDIGSYIAALLSILFLLGLNWLYKDYQVDKYRQRLFNIRDQFFSSAMKGEISFDSEAYGLIRLLLNSHIRFAHRLSLGRLLLINKFIKPEFDVLKQELFGAKIAKARAKLEDEQKDYVDQVLQQLHVLVLVHIVERSVILNFLFSLAYYVSRLPAIGAISKSIVDRIVIRQASKVDTIAVTNADSCESPDQQLAL